MRITYGFAVVFSIGVIGTVVLAVMTAGASAKVKGDMNCDGSVNPVDSLLILRHDAGLSVNLPPGCDAIGSAGGAARSASAVNPKGDMNCNGFVNPVDSLLLLRHDAGLNVNLPADCDVIGSSVSTPTPEQTLPPKPSFTAVPTATQPTLPPTASPTTPPTLPPLPTAAPSNAGFCWIPIIADGGVNGFFSSATCSSFGEPSYTCTAIGSFVFCSTSSFDSPDYSCNVIGFFISCNTFSFDWPDYSCNVIGFFVSCNTFSFDWPDYSCNVIGSFVFCNTSSFDWPDYTCSVIGSSYFC